MGPRTKDQGKDGNQEQGTREKNQTFLGASSRLAVAGTATPCSPYAPIADARDGRSFRHSHGRHPIAGLEGNPVAVPATAKLSAKLSATDRLFLLRFLLPLVLGPVFPWSYLFFAHDALLAMVVQFAICNLQFAIVSSRA